MTLVRSGNAKASRPSKKGDKKNPLFLKKVLTNQSIGCIIKTDKKKETVKNENVSRISPF